MPTVAQCPSCGASLSEVAVLALAPVCSRCGAVITTVGGTLGLTSAFGVGRSTITKARVEADLKVLQDYLANYRGMMEACRQQLQWGADRYARVPPPPDLLLLL